MSGSIIVTALAFLHVVSAIGWLGGAALFLSAIIPGLRSLSPQASLEFLTKVGPRATRFFIGASTATVIFGIALFAASGVNDPALLVGAGLGLIAYLDAVAFTVPAFRKADKLAHQMMANPQEGPPPPEFLSSLRRGGLGVTAVVVILVITSLFMVVSGYMY